MPDEFSGLDTSSPELIEKLIEKRAPQLSQVDRKTIADSSGGNARVALALASTVGKNETVAGLSDAELFTRLFQQRNNPDANLLSIAQVCSLVYSFEGERLDGDESELPILGGLVNKSVADVFAVVAELRQRHLVQARGPWRAVLPHAIANRLATAALQRIPRENLLSTMVERAPPRLLRSFSRRLGYLNSSKEAQDIVEGWLAPNGLLADVANLDELGRAMFENIAPVAPSAVLSAMENTLADTADITLSKCERFVRLLRSLAYDAEYFCARCDAADAVRPTAPRRSFERQRSKCLWIPLLRCAVRHARADWDALGSRRGSVAFDGYRQAIARCRRAGGNA
jgi:hypothetical protein